MNNGITALLYVLNEEKRIEYTLKSFSWCEKILVTDKGNTDKTNEICKKYKNVEIVRFKKCSLLEEAKLLHNLVKTKWTITITASDIITKELALKISKTISLIEKDYDIINIPYKPYFLGSNEKYSPWFQKNRNYFYKKDIIDISFEGGVHNIVKYNSDKIYKMKLYDDNEGLYHLTHESGKGIVNRYLLYLSQEGESTNLNSELWYIFKQLIKLLFFKRSFFRGKKSLALSFSFLSYYMLKYVINWDLQNGNADQTYKNIRKKVINDWGR